MSERIMSLFLSRVTIEFNEVFMLCASGEELTDELVEEIGCVVELLVSSGRLSFLTFDELTAGV